MWTLNGRLDSIRFFQIFNVNSLHSNVVYTFQRCNRLTIMNLKKREATWLHPFDTVVKQTTVLIANHYNQPLYLQQSLIVFGCVLPSKSKIVCPNWIQAFLNTIRTKYAMIRYLCHLIVIRVPPKHPTIVSLFPCNSIKWLEFHLTNKKKNPVIWIVLKDFLIFLYGVLDMNFCCERFLGISNERNFRNVNTFILPAPKISHKNYVCVKERQQYYLTSSICKMWLFQRTKRRQNVIIKEFDGEFPRILCAIKPKNSKKSLIIMQYARLNEQPVRNNLHRTL